MKKFLVLLVVLAGFFGLSQTAEAKVLTPCNAVESINGVFTQCELYSISSNSASDVVIWKIYEAGGILRATVNPYPGYKGGIAVAHADVDNDGTDEWITAPDNGGLLKIWSPLGVLKAQIGPMPKDPVIVTGNFDSTPNQEIVIASGTSGRKFIIYHYSANRGGMFTAEVVNTYDRSYNRGLELAVGDINGDQYQEIVYAPAYGSGDIVVYSPHPATSDAWRVRTSISRASQDGTRLRVGNVTGDAKDEIIYSSRTADHPTIVPPHQIFIYGWDANSLTLKNITHFAAYGYRWYPYGPNSGANFELADVSGSAWKEIITAPWMHKKGPIAVWQIVNGTARTIATATIYGSNVAGVNILPLNYSPDKDTSNGGQHDEILLIPKSGSPRLAVLRFLVKDGAGKLETVWTFNPLSPSYQRETRFNR